MRVANSEGGPFIGLSRNQLQHWNGIAGKGFVGESSSFLNDYDAASAAVLRKPRSSIAKLSGLWGEALFLTMPLETAVVETDLTSTLIAQVHYADADWSFAKLTRVDFMKAQFNEHISFSFKVGEFVFFDAAYSHEDVGDDYVSFPLASGDYVLSAALYNPDERTHCILYKIEPSA